MKPKEPRPLREAQGTAWRLARAFAKQQEATAAFEATCKEILGSTVLTSAVTLSPSFDAEYAAALREFGLRTGTRKDRVGIWRTH